MKSISPSLHYYVVLMLQELGKTWEEVQSEDDRELIEDEDE